MLKHKEKDPERHKSSHRRKRERRLRREQEKQQKWIEASSQNDVNNDRDRKEADSTKNAEQEPKESTGKEEKKSRRERKERKRLKEKLLEKKREKKQKEKKLKIPLEVRRQAVQRLAEILSSEQGITAKHLLPILALLVANSQGIKDKINNMLSSPSVQQALNNGLRSLLENAQDSNSPSAENQSNNESLNKDELMNKLKNFASNQLNLPDPNTKDIASTEPATGK